MSGAVEAPTRVTVGGPDCKQPYSMSALNISAMSFGALSGNAITALNEGARIGDRSVLAAGVVIGARAVTGADCVFHPRAVLLHDCVAGDRVVVGAKNGTLDGIR